MKTYLDDALRFDSIRAHPWNIAAHDQRGKYVDFKVEGSAVEQHLEDFQPYSHHAGVQRFYDLIRALNHSGSALETNDCALDPPGPHHDSNSERPLRLRVRLCLLYRNVHYNLHPGAMRWLGDAFGSQLEAIDRGWAAEEAVIPFTSQPTAFVDLPGEAEILKGQLLMLTFWLYGRNQLEAFDMLARAARNVLAASQAISKHVNASFNRQNILDEVQATWSQLILPESDDLKHA